MKKIPILLISYLLLLNGCSIFQGTTKNRCPSDLKDFNGRTYKVVQIGKQCWMAENLASTHYADGAKIENVFVYNDDEANAGEYGRLYTWDAAMNGAAESDEVPSGIIGACPKGWHLPSDNEWKKLERTLGVKKRNLNRQGWSTGEEGGKLKEKGTKHWNEPNKGATNKTGFTAIAAGSRNFGGVYTGKGISSFYWTSSMLYSLTSWGRGLGTSSAGIYRFNDDPGSAFSIRCVKDW